MADSQVAHIVAGAEIDKGRCRTETGKARDLLAQMKQLYVSGNMTWYVKATK
jgi:hypothetical protein